MLKVYSYRTPLVNLQVAYPILTIYRRRVLLNPSGASNEPLLCRLTDFIYWRALESLPRISKTLIREVSHLFAVLAGLLWKSINQNTGPPFIFLV